MSALELQAIASYSSLRIIDSLAEGFVVCMFAAMLLRWSRGQSAATRFALGFSALLATALLPFARTLWMRADFPSRGPAVEVPESWALYLFSAWAVIATLLLGRVARSIWQVRKLRGACVPLDLRSIDPLLLNTLRRKRTLRRVTLCTSEQVRMPTAIGFINPAIVIPRWVMQDLSTAELNQVVLHELAHLRRWDDWTNLAQQIVKALFFFHPAVWWMEKKISLEREMACDDAVLAETESPRAYAECLAHLAERNWLQRSIALAQALVGRIAQTSQRVARILEGNRPKGTSSVWKPVVAAMAGVAMLSAVVSRTPELVGFENGKANAVALVRSLPDPGIVPITNAALPQGSGVERAAIKASPAKLSRKRAQPKGDVGGGQQVAVRSQNSGNLVHLTAMKSRPMPASAAVLVFIEREELGAGDSSVYRIQMWHVMILPATEAVGSKAPSRKT